MRKRATIICIQDGKFLAVQERGQKHYSLPGGDGWSLRDFYLRGGLDAHLSYSKLVNLQSLESFIALANQGAL